MIRGGGGGEGAGELRDNKQMKMRGKKVWDSLGRYLGTKVRDEVVMSADGFVIEKSEKAT
jgi:hypothetical protein